jgi:heme A synthase
LEPTQSDIFQTICERKFYLPDIIEGYNSLKHARSLQEPQSEYDVPRVSPYRLAAHLTSAFVIYSGLLWTALTVAAPTPPALSQLAAQAGATLRGKIHPLAALIGVTALSGAFVAGLDAVSLHVPEYL